MNISHLRHFLPKETFLVTIWNMYTILYMKDIHLYYQLPVFCYVWKDVNFVWLIVSRLRKWTFIFSESYLYDLISALRLNYSINVAPSRLEHNCCGNVTRKLLEIIIPFAICINTMHFADSAENPFFHTVFYWYWT